MAKINCIAIFETSSYILSKTGVLFTKKLCKKDIVKIVLNISFDLVMNTLIVLNIRNSLKVKDIRLTNWMVCVLLPMENYMAKRMTILINNKCLLSLIRIVNSEVFNNHDQKQNRHIQILNKISKLMLRYLALTMTISVTIFCILPFVIDANVSLPLPFEAKKFEMPYKCLHFLAIFYVALNTTGLDIFYMALLGLANAQLNILEERLMNILKDAIQIQKSAEEVDCNHVNSVSEDILKKCIILHKTIIEFVKELTVLLSFPLFVQYTCGCLLICNTILQVTVMGQTKTSHLLGITGYSSVIFFQMAAYHWWANEIIFKSDKLVESCYLSNWYELNLSCQKSFILLMERAQKPLIVKLYNLVDISLYSLGVVVRWSYSVFALIKASYA